MSPKQKLIPYQLGIGITGYALQTGEYIVTDYMTKHPKFSADIDNVKDVQPPLHNIMIVPFYSVMNPTVPVGILQFINTRSRHKISQFQIDMALAVRDFLGS